MTAHQRPYIVTEMGSLERLAYGGGEQIDLLNVRMVRRHDSRHWEMGTPDQQDLATAVGLIVYKTITDGIVRADARAAEAGYEDCGKIVVTPLIAALLVDVGILTIQTIVDGSYDSEARQWNGGWQIDGRRFVLEITDPNHAKASIEFYSAGFPRYWLTSASPDHLDEMSRLVIHRM